MANTCKTCQRPDVDEINQHLTSGKSLRYIVDNYQIPQGSIQRHKDNCLNELFAEVREQKRAGLLADVDEVKAEILAVAQQFPTNGNVRVQLIARRLDAIEKEAKLTGAYVKDAPNPADMEKVLEAYRLWADKNPGASLEERREAVRIFASGRDIDVRVLAEKAGITELPTVQ